MRFFGICILAIVRNFELDKVQDELDKAQDELGQFSQGVRKNSVELYTNYIK